MARLLMIVSSARSLRLADGTPHRTGYWAEEVLKPYERFVAEGVEVVVATPDGQPPQPDPYGLEPQFHYADEDKDFLAAVIRSFAPEVENVRITLHLLTGLNLIMARSVWRALVDSGVDRETARQAINACARIVWREDRDLLDVLVADPLVGARLTRDQLDRLAQAVHAHSEAEARRVAATLAAIEPLNRPRNLAQLSDTEIRSFDAVFFPGGHGPMVDLADNPDVARVLRLMHEREQPIAALCHGPAAFLSAEPGADGAWLFDGYKLVAFTDEEEDQTPVGKQGAPWYLESALKNAGAVFDDGDVAWVSHVVVDRNLVTAQNPASSQAAAEAVLKKMGVM